MLRPVGRALGDQRAARACRVIFSATTDEDVELAHWAVGQEFPPKSNTLAITSAAETHNPMEGIGMEYLGLKSSVAEYNEPSGILKKISIFRRFGE